MFLEKHEPAIIENDFTWFDENGNYNNVEDSEFDRQIAKINRYIVEVSQNNLVTVPKFIYWLLENNYKIYCFSDCRNYIDSMTKIQKIIFEREQLKANWVPFPKEKRIFVKESKSIEDFKAIDFNFILCSKSNLEFNSLADVFVNLKLTTSRFPNLSFTKLLPEDKDLIIGKISYGESYFKPGTKEEPMVLICYTADSL